MKGFRVALVLMVLLTLAPGVLAAPLPLPPVQTGESAEYVVVYAQGASLEEARSAIAAAGGTIVKENASARVATVLSNNTNFLAAIAVQRSLFVGAMKNRPVARIEPGFQPSADPEVEKRLPASEAAAATPAATMEATQALTAAVAAEPLSNLQWNMEMIDATATTSYAVNTGSPRVLVGILDSGIDATHPDLAPNFSSALSRNFATDIPAIDGPCEYPDCKDPADVDHSGHGTHVAGIVGAALNGLGLAGVAPNVTLVNIRGGQDSGYVFLQPVVDALVYAGDIGIDVVNMSFYIDPWLFNCPDNPADSPEAQMEQRAIIAATQNAVDYARSKGVTLVVSAGNSHYDLGHPYEDTTSPDYPPGESYFRAIDNTCLSMPVEAEGVIVVSALGPSKAKADYSNYGVEQTNLSAPGGYFRDLLGTPDYRQFTNLVLSSYPKSLLEAAGALDPNGVPLDPDVRWDCQNGTCAYYVYLQGTSMASPHVTGVAALVASQFGKKDLEHPGGLKLNPSANFAVLTKSAEDTACPEPRLMDYTLVGRPPSFNAYCEGTPEFNGFYGEGIVNALNAVLGRSGRQ